MRPTLTTRSLAEAYGIGDRLVHPNSGREHPSVDDDTLRLIYNSCEKPRKYVTGRGLGAG